jgi:hypothetical protein
MQVPAATALPAKEGKNIYKEDKKGKKGTKKNTMYSYTNTNPRSYL